MRDLQTHIPKETLVEYALDVLRSEEIASIRSHLRSCPQCQQEVASLQRTAGLLPYGLPDIEPPVELRDRIVNGAKSGWTATRPEQQPVRQPSARPGWLRRLAPALVAFTFVVGLLLGRALPGSTPGLQTNGEGQTVALVGQGSGSVLLANNHSYMRVMVNGLPPLEAGKVYQLWFVGRSAPISAGTFAVGTDGSGQFELNGLAWSSEYTGIAITIEPLGGNAAPTSDAIAKAEL